MLKKISYIIISVAILIAGYFALGKLNYWERSTRIFNLNSSQAFEGRTGRGLGRFEGREIFGGRGGFERPVMRELPDSIRARFEAGGGRPIMRDRNIPDSLRQQFRQNEGERIERGGFRGGMRDGEGRGRGGFPGGKKINLRSVAWFLAVFAAFTVISIYLDKAYCLIKKRRNGAKTQITGL